ncbi:MAG: phage terminase large subunit, partial [Micropepsaceae bacterium]
QLIQELLVDGLHSVKGIEPAGDKVMRLHAQTATIENGFVYIPEHAPWLDDYLHELTAFPNAKHDDQVDSTAQALQWLKATPEPGFLGYYRMLYAEENRKRGFTIELRTADAHIQWVNTCTGREVRIVNRTIWVNEAEAAELLRCGWKAI